MKPKKAAIGRPPKFTCKEEIEEKIEAYFTNCEGKPLTNANGDPVLDNRGYPVIVGRRPLTVTGLALALGFTSRLDLLRYQGKKEFCNTITRAKARVEQYAEERLYDRDGSSGAQFSLKNNFRGWSDRTELDEEEQRIRIEKLAAEAERIRRDAVTDDSDGVEIINDAPG